jgi:hypothetical protein
LIAHMIKMVCKKIFENPIWTCQVSEKGKGFFWFIIEEQSGENEENETKGMGAGLCIVFEYCGRCCSARL